MLRSGSERKAGIRFPSEDAPNAMPQLTPAIVDALRAVAAEQGIVRLGAVSLSDPGFEPSAARLRAYVEQGRQGEMEFMARTLGVRIDPAQMLPGARSMLVGLVPYRGHAGPIARYAQGGDYHTELHRRFEPVLEALQHHLPQAQSLVCVDTKPVAERAAAALAGLGFLGKHGCLIAPGLGSYVLLGEILCTASWQPEPEASPSRDKLLWDACGSCRLCLDACPTNAFVSPGELDPRRCISYLTIEHRGPIEPDLADRLGERVAGCDVCQEVCPYNAAPGREARVPESAFLPEHHDDRPPAEPAELANIRSGRYRAFVRHSALRRIPRKSLRRNALLALGNRPGPLTDSERQTVEQACSDEDQQIRAAAARVLARRG